MGLALLTALYLLLVAASITSAYTTLTDDTLKNLPSPGDDFDIKKGPLLAPILRTRVPGTEGSAAVLQHFVDFFRNTLPEWRIEFQNSTSTTPVTGDEKIPFRNLIATRDPPWTTIGDVSRLALVAHYDSKLTPEGFIGAIDSAAPCAMLMHAARSIDSALTRKWQKMEAEGVGAQGYDGVAEHKGVQIILLDGEEAFATWTHTDSLYGARSLAETWEASPHPARSTFRNPISSISLFLLLDLLGSKDPTIPSYFVTTHWAYRALGKIEQRLRSLGLFGSSPNHPPKLVERRKRAMARKNYDPNKSLLRREPRWLFEADLEHTVSRGFVEDDHIPFMLRGVEILHMIPTPFPPVWHNMEDDGEHLHLPTVKDWALLTTAFAAEWMDLEGFVQASAGPRREYDNEASDRRRRKPTEEKSEL